MMPEGGIAMQADRNRLFSTPFSKAYGKQAMADFKNLRMLVFAALMIALRIALKPVSIPIAADLRINAGFFINAYGAMVFGPVMAIFGAIVSDTLGYLVFPDGIYFFPFVLTEIAGSLIFALFLYRTEVSTVRIVLARFCVDMLVNVVLNAPIMALYYTMIMGRSYALFDVLRIVKNLAMFPLESILLIIFMRLVIPPTQKLGYVFSGTQRLKFNKRTIVLLGVLLVFSICTITGYYIWNYNTTSFSAAYTSEERLNRNNEMTDWVRADTPELADQNLVVIIESARSKVGNPEMTYELAVYALDEAVLAGESDVTETQIRGYSKSKAAKEPALGRLCSGIAVTDKKSGAHLRLTLDLGESH